MRHAGLTSDRLIIGASLAKAFGAPVAVLAGPASLIEEFKSESATQVHCSPPSASAIAAASHALAINQRHGDVLRTKLAHRVSRFRQGLRRLGFLAIPGLFPMQPLHLPSHVEASKLRDLLSRRGVETVLHKGPRGRDARISFVLTARHSFRDIDRALVHLAAAADRSEFERS